MNQAEFTGLMQGQPTSLETWIQTSDDQIAQGQDPPDGGDFGGFGVAIKPDGTRWAYRNYCEWEEVALPDGSKAVYTHADAGAASRF